jgi:hypothetical protein
MNDPNASKGFVTRRFRTQRRCLAAGVVPLVLALGLTQLALAQDPIITLQPTSRTISEGENVTFRSVAMTTNGPMSYQWQRDDAVAPQLTFTNIPNAYRSSLNLMSVTLAQAGDYRVVVSNAAGESVTSQVATLTVEAKLFLAIAEGPHVTDLGASGYGGWGDYDGDGFSDLSVDRYNNHGTSCVYRNNGDGSFSRLANPPSLPSEVYFGPWGDWDNDGRLEGMVWGSGGRSIGFRDSDGNILPSALSITAVAWHATADYDRDGFLDAYFNNGNRLCRNFGGFSFASMSTGEVGPILGSSWGGACWGDFDDDGWPDLYVPSLWTGKCYMFRNEGTGRFVAVNNLITRTASQPFKGAWGDYDNDGRLDLCAVSFNGTTTVYRNLGDGEFEQPNGLPSVVGPHNFGTWVDFNNDGFLDLWVSGWTSGNKLFRNNGDGSFKQVTTESLVTDRPINGAGNFAVAWFDYDNNGFLDAYLFDGYDADDGWTANQLYQNQGNKNAWLTVKPIGTLSNRQGVGAKVRVQANFAGQVRWQRRDITGDGLDNGSHRYAHFGLGNATQVDVLRIEWPSGIAQEFKNLAVKQILTVTEARQLRLDCSLRPSDGAFVLTVTADPGQQVKVYGSEDLANWIEVGELTGGGEVLDMPTGTALQFFKTQALP